MFTKGNQVMRSIMFSLFQRSRKGLRSHMTLAVVAAIGVLALVPGVAFATETEGEKGVKEVATQISGEGTTIILAVLAALIGLIAISIILPKAVKWVKKFV